MKTVITLLVWGFLLGLKPGVWGKVEKRSEVAYTTNDEEGESYEAAYDEDFGFSYEDSAVTGPETASMVKGPSYEIVPNKGTISPPSTTMPTGTDGKQHVPTTTKRTHAFQGYMGVLIALVYIFFIVGLCLVIGLLIIVCSALVRHYRLNLPRNPVPVQRVNVPRPLPNFPLQPVVAEPARRANPVAQLAASTLAVFHNEP